MNTVTALLRNATEQAAIVIHLSACPLLPQIFAAETTTPFCSFPLRLRLERPCDSSVQAAMVSL